jgi:fumarate hydratase class I
MSTIRQQDFIDSIEDALQYISFYHPLDFVQALDKAYQKEESKAAKDAIAQILINSRMSAEGKRPLCQDTGIVTCFVKVGMDVKWDKTNLTVQQMVDEGTRRAYLSPDNPLRASIVADPAGTRKNTKDNTPSVVHIDLVPGAEVEVMIAAKGGGSENKTKMVMLNPSDDVAAWVEKTLPTMGAGWCPPGMLGIGIGGTAEKAAVLAKESLMDPVDIHELMARGAETAEEKLRLEIFDRANKTGIGAQGLGGLTTVVDIKIKTAPTHAASKPVVMIPNCAATRHVHFTLDGSGPAELTAPKLEDWPEVTFEVGEDTRRVDLDTLTKEEMAEWKMGETLLLSGTILTGRDAAHKRL